MNKKAPFSKKQPSVCSRQEFYWRGGDVLKEQEFLSMEYRRLAQEKMKADEELSKTEASVNSAQDMLKEREGYSNALAGFLESDTESAFEENNLRHELQNIEKEISEKEAELSKYTKQLAPNVYSSLNKERAFFLLENQKLEKELQNYVSKADMYRNDLTTLMTTPRYRRGITLEYKVDKEIRKRNYLRKMVNKAKMENDNTKPPVSIANSKSINSEREVLLQGIDTKLAINISNEKLSRHPAKYRAELEFLIRQIEDLNDRMLDVGCEDGVVDVNSLRESIFATGTEEEEEQRENSCVTNQSINYETIDDIKSPNKSMVSSECQSPKNVD